jgi:hypothetical protein
VPCFGVHPWHAHLHALGGEAEELLEGKSQADVATAEAALCERGDVALPREHWEPELRRLLTFYPTAIVGECAGPRALRSPASPLHACMPPAPFPRLSPVKDLSTGRNATRLGQRLMGLACSAQTTCPNYMVRVSSV